MLTNADWEAINTAIRSAVSDPSEVTYGRVVKRDVKRKLIWLKEFGNQPIPLVGFKGTVKVYDTTASGTTVTKRKIEYEVPKKGELVVVLRQMGTRRLPKCVGVVLSTEFISA